MMMKYETQQPGCFWGLVHNFKKIKRHTGGWTTLENNDYEDRVLDDKSFRVRKKRSLRARLKALLFEETSKQNSTTFEPSLHRTYSIHHLESFDEGFNKICTDWNNQLLFLPKDADDATSQSSDTIQLNENDADPDVFHIFKVDKELLLKNLQHSHSHSGISTKAKFSKSRSFPVAYLADGRKLKPANLESKQTEVWSFPKENKSQTVEGFGENVMRKRTNRRSLSLVESLDKYARLLENSSGKDAKLNSSKSLKLPNEYGLAPLHFTRIHSLSYVDSDNSNLNFDNPSVVVENDSSSGMPKEHVSDDQNTSMNTDMQIEEDSGSSNNMDDLREEEKELHNHGSISDTNFFLQTTNAQIFEKDETADNVTDKCPKKKNSDMDYVRHVLDQSGIVVDAADMAWHSSELPLSPQLFEELESRWPHEEDELNGWPDFHGCWHHQTVFDLVNEALVEIYDASLPYYPKALSSSCHVGRFPVGNCIVEEVCRSIGRLRDVKGDEKQSVDWIVGRDLGWDHSWMNLQLETEFIAFHLEDIIFNELLHEVVCC